MKAVIVKIDVVGSKQYIIDLNIGNEGRKHLLNVVLKSIRETYLNSNQLYPEGILYSSQGDCFYLVMDDIDSAIQQTVSFLDRWHEVRGSVPDCRAAMAYDEIDEIRLMERIELVSTAFEEISVIEKHAYQGQILVTGSVAENSVKYHESFVEKGLEELGDRRKFMFCRLVYDDPRIRGGVVIYNTGELEDLEPELLREILKRCPVGLLAASLHGMSPKMHELASELLTPEMRLELEEHPLSKTSIRLNDILKAHRELVEIANSVIRGSML